MDDNQGLEDVQHDLDKPRIALYKNTWTAHQNIENWCNLELAQRKGLQFYQTRSHAIILFNTQHAICIEKVVYMKTGEDSNCKIHQSPRLPRVVLAPKAQYGRQDPPNPEARKSTDHHREQSVQYRETCRSLLEGSRCEHPEESQRCLYREACRGNVDYRIPGTPHTTVEKEDTNRKETVKRLIQQIENHPNRDSLKKDLNKNEEFNPFSGESKKLITDMDNTEIFALYETSSKMQCPGCAFFSWHRTLHMRQMHAAYGKESTDEQGKDSTFCQLLATSSKRLHPTVPDMDHLCGKPCTSKHMICSGKPAIPKMIIAKLFWKDGTEMTNTVHISQTLGGLKNRLNNMTHTCIGTSFICGFT